MAATNTDASLSLGPRAWALQASGGAVAEAIRPFAGSLHPGDVVSFVFENGWVDTEPRSSVGVAFQNRFGQNLLQFVFQGGTQTYEILDHNPRDSEINWSDSPHVCTLELLTPLTYRLTVNGVVFEGELAETSEVLISRIRFWNYNAGPEPQAKYFIGDLSIAGAPLPVFTSSSEIAVTRAASPLRQTSSFESTGDGLVATLSNVSGIDGNVWIADAILDGDWNWTLPREIPSSIGCSRPSARSSTTRWNTPSNRPTHRASARGRRLRADGSFPEANRRHYQFMLEGLRETQPPRRARHRLLPPPRARPRRSSPNSPKPPRLLVGDVGYCACSASGARRWRGASPAPSSLVESDAIVPVAEVSDHAEFAARTLRPKIHRLLPNSSSRSRPCAVAVPSVASSSARCRSTIRQRCAANSAWTRACRPPTDSPAASPPPPAPVPLHRPPASADYAEENSDPVLDACSGMSPYLHFGQISPLDIALRVQASDAPRAATDAYLEQLIVRRELSLNACWFNPGYDRYGSLPAWALQDAGQAPLRQARVPLCPRAMGSRRHARSLLERRPEPKWSAPAACTTTCACTGAKSSSNGPAPPKKPSKPRSISTTSTNWTDATPTASSAWPGASAATTAPGPSAPSSAPSAT
jgi:hypothetical protein